MLDSLNQTASEMEASTFLQDLYNSAIQGDPEAARELSIIALGGWRKAQVLVRRMDAELSKVKSEMV